KNAQWLAAHPEFTVTLEGHCDERGTNEYNLSLGDRRAAAARDYLGSLGVAANRLRTISYGEEGPFCPPSDESCWGQNPRAHFLITGRPKVGWASDPPAPPAAPMVAAPAGGRGGGRRGMRHHHR